MAIDQTLFRQLAGSFATGVTVITTGAEGSFRGMTASSFASLSLDPTLVLVCVDKSAETLAVLKAAGRFNVNILSAEQEGLSRTFARKESPEAHGLTGIDYRLGELGLPVLNGSLAYLECEVVEQYDGGDHIIFLGEVMHGELGAPDLPLLYFRGRYRGVEELPPP
jgi:flavin reductase (DIM6/NTAB) family NADH-FMN oxidoreductase RutF